jgi:hypothetical protein
MARSKKSSESNTDLKNRQFSNWPRLLPGSSWESRGANQFAPFGLVGGSAQGMQIWRDNGCLGPRPKDDTRSVQRWSRHKDLENMASDFALSRASQLQVIRLIGDGSMPKGAHNLPLFQKEHARHLLGIFFDQANSILE